MHGVVHVNMEPQTCEPRIVERSDHGISRRDIDPDALKILYRLHNSGYCGYLVGGGVRDLMLSRRPKDFDIATDARPRQIKRLFRNCRIIGRRFRLAHLHYPGDKIIEVATFRSTSGSDGIVRDGELIQRDNVFGTAAEDAKRRDLTINGLFYNIADFTVIDYVGGVDDLRAGQIRTINDPVGSFREDPVRMMRAIRHATRLGFVIEPETHRAVLAEQDEITKANPSRLIEELYKDLASGHSLPYFECLHEYGLLRILLPELAGTFRKRGPQAGKTVLFETLGRLDELRAQGREITHSMGLAALLAPLIRPVLDDLVGGKVPRGLSALQFVDGQIGTYLRRIRVYRRDQERLVHCLAAWPRLKTALERGALPVALRQRHYLHEAVEILAILSDPDDAVLALRDEVRELPPVDSSQPAVHDDEDGDEHRQSRRRPARGGVRGTNDADESSEGGRKRRRRRGRRRRPGTRGGADARTPATSSENGAGADAGDGADEA